MCQNPLKLWLWFLSKKIGPKIVWYKNNSCPKNFTPKSVGSKTRSKKVRSQKVLVQKIEVKKCRSKKTSNIGSVTAEIFLIWTIVAWTNVNLIIGRSCFIKLYLGPSLEDCKSPHICLCSTHATSAPNLYLFLRELNFCSDSPLGVLYMLSRLIPDSYVF